MKSRIYRILMRIWILLFEICLKMLKMLCSQVSVKLCSVFIQENLLKEFGTNLVLEKKTLEEAMVYFVSKSAVLAAKTTKTK